MSTPKLRGDFDPENTGPYVSSVMRSVKTTLDELYQKGTKEFRAKNAFAETFLSQVRALVSEARTVNDVLEVTDDIIEILKLNKKAKSFKNFPFADLLTVAGAETQLFESEQELIDLFVKPILTMKTHEEVQRKIVVWKKNSHSQQEYRDEKWNELFDRFYELFPYDTPEDNGSREAIEEFTDTVNDQIFTWVEEYQKAEKNYEFIRNSHGCPLMRELIQKIAILCARYDAHKSGFQDYPWIPFLQHAGAYTGVFQSEEDMNNEFVTPILTIKRQLYESLLSYKNAKKLFKDAKKPGFQKPKKYYSFDDVDIVDKKDITKRVEKINFDHLEDYELGPPPNLEELAKISFDAQHNSKSGFDRSNVPPRPAAAAAAAGPERSQSRRRSRPRSPMAAAAASPERSQSRRRSRPRSPAAAAPPAEAPVNKLNVRRKKPPASEETRKESMARKASAARKESAARKQRAESAARKQRAESAARKASAERRRAARRAEEEAAGTPLGYDSSASRSPSPRINVQLNTRRRRQRVNDSPSPQRPQRRRSPSRSRSASRRPSVPPQRGYGQSSRHSAARPQTTMARRMREIERLRDVQPTGQRKLQSQSSRRFFSKRRTDSIERYELRAARDQMIENQKRLGQNMNQYSNNRRQLSNNRRQLSDRRRQISAARKQVSANRRQVSVRRQQMSADRRRFNEDLRKLNADQRQFSAERKRGGGGRVNGECPQGCVKDTRKPCKIGQVRTENGRCKNIQR